jgi:hypothetical protein
MSYFLFVFAASVTFRQEPRHYAVEPLPRENFEELPWINGHFVAFEWDQVSTVVQIYRCQYVCLKSLMYIWTNQAVSHHRQPMAHVARMQEPSPRGSRNSAGCAARSSDRRKPLRPMAHYGQWVPLPRRATLDTASNIYLLQKVSVQ